MLKIKIRWTWSLPSFLISLHFICSLFIIYLLFYCKQSLHKGLGPLSRPNHIQIKISPLAGRPAPPLSSPESTVSLHSIDYRTNRFSLELNNIKLLKIYAYTKIIGNLSRRLLEFKDLEWSLSNSIPSAEQLVNKNNITHLPIGCK